MLGGVCNPYHGVSRAFFMALWGLPVAFQWPPVASRGLSTASFDPPVARFGLRGLPETARLATCHLAHPRRSPPLLFHSPDVFPNLEVTKDYDHII